MTDEPSSLSQRAEAQAKAKARRAKRIERREAFLDLVASGYSYRQIATAMRVSLATVRREVDKALAERPIHAPEHHASLQVARLTRALCHADHKLAQGDVRAVGTLHESPRRARPLSRPRRAFASAPRSADRKRPHCAAAASRPSPHRPRPLCRRSRRKLHDSAPKTLKSLARLSTSRSSPGRDGEAVSRPRPRPARPSRRSHRKLHNSAVQDVEIAGALIDTAGSAGRDGDPSLALAQAEPALPPLPPEVAQFGAQDVEIAGAPIDTAGSAERDGDPSSRPRPHRAGPPATPAGSCTIRHPRR